MFPLYLNVITNEETVKGHTKPVPAKMLTGHLPQMKEEWQHSIRILCSIDSAQCK